MVPTVPTVPTPPAPRSPLVLLLPTLWVLVSSVLPSLPVSLSYSKFFNFEFRDIILL
ncbi:hypothetical protein AWRI1631_47360 [Saccharomyces cerevisiae AWRI1631]|uniref:Uncharacterized protein n=1 Tax=Saccharomyces cerevisiae (strain AWRI1631) TaxID=545124 RepID=B5VH44_YEAS6|nr:hypothetical protein AWRI1631_47360 [Saccharomyces cerevisiae AWRI1631]